MFPWPLFTDFGSLMTDFEVTALYYVVNAEGAGGGGLSILTFFVYALPSLSTRRWIWSSFVDAAADDIA